MHIRTLIIVEIDRCWNTVVWQHMIYLIKNELLSTMKSSWSTLLSICDLYNFDKTDQNLYLLVVRAPSNTAPSCFNDICVRSTLLGGVCVCICNALVETSQFFTAMSGTKNAHSDLRIACLVRVHVAERTT